MGDDERRAEIEAMRAAHNAYYNQPLDQPLPPGACLEALERAIDAYLDRLRDARGDDVKIVERDAPLLEVVRGPYARALTRIAELEAQLEAARSPQGEDHDPTPRVTPEQAERARGMGRGGGAMGKRRPEQPPPGGRPSR